MKIAKMNGDTIVEVGSHRTLFPNTNFYSAEPNDAWLLNNSCVKVVTFLSFDNATHKSESVEPYLSDGEVYIRRVVELTTDEKAAKTADAIAETKLRNRAERDKRLADCDWVVIKALEAGTSVASDWVTYRTALRDITAHSNWPDLEYPDMDGTGGDWPTSP
tara:strand:- start:17552 stop:18037 length:486 start_codon:yes stop_codon:yes gene_type:complete